MEASCGHLVVEHRYKIFVWRALKDFLYILFSKTMVFMRVRDFDVKNIVGF